MRFLARLSAGIRAFTNRLVSFIPSWYDYAISQGEIHAERYCGINHARVEPGETVILRAEGGVHADLRVKKLVIDSSDFQGLGVLGIWVGPERLPFPEKVTPDSFLPLDVFRLNGPRSPDLERRLVRAGGELRVEIKNFGDKSEMVAAGFITDELSAHASEDVKDRFRDNVRSPLGLSFA